MNKFPPFFLLLSVIFAPSIIRAAEMIGSFGLHESPVSDVYQLSQRAPGAPTALSADFSGTVIYWDVAKNAVLWQLPGPLPRGSELTRLALSPKGDLFSVLRAGMDLVIREVSTGKVRCRLQVPEDEAHEVWWTGAFSLTERVFAVSSRTRLLSFFDTSTGQHIRTIRDFRDPLTEDGAFIIGFTSDERFLTFVGTDLAGVVSWNDGSILKTIPLRDFGVINYGIFSNDLRLFALASEKSYFLLDTQKLEVLHSIQKPNEDYAHGLFTSNLQFDAASRALHAWNVSMESPWPGVYEEVNVVSGKKEKSLAVHETIFNPGDSGRYFVMLSTLIPGSGLLLSGGRDPSGIYIWKL